LAPERYAHDGLLLKHQTQVGKQAINKKVDGFLLE
jgi:hypothetical protein